MTEHGGARPGAGRKKGGMNAATKRMMRVKQKYEQRALKHADRLLSAQLALATGVQMLFVIHTDAKGVRRKPEMITDPELISRFLDEHGGSDGVLDMGDKNTEDYFFMTTKVPDERAIQDILDRIFAKAPQSLDITSGGEKLTSAPLIISDVTTPAETPGR